MNALIIAAFVLGGLGASMTAINFYLSCVRYPLHRFFRRDEPYKWVSGFPVFGSLFLWIAAVPLWWFGQRHWAIGTLVVSLLDTGGLIWVIIAMVSQPRRDGT
jgi:hypothetical protein